MSIAELSDIRYRHFGGFNDPRLPTASWFGTVTVTGDASGGTRQATLVMNRVTALRQSRYYSIEGIRATDGDNVAKAARFQTQNLGRFAHQVNLNLVASVGASAELDPLSLLVMRKVFLGQQGGDNTTTGLSLTVTNSDGDAITFSAEGYTWGPEAASAVDGGVLRPSMGLWSS